MNEVFKLPIEYLDNKQLVESNIINDLELVKMTDVNDTEKPLLEYILNTKSSIGKQLLNSQTKYYTNDKGFLKNTQKLIGKWKQTNTAENAKIYDTFYETWNEVKEDIDFIDKYYYVDIDYFKFLNNSPQFLQILSLYNLISPILTIILPIMLLIVPFFMLKFSGISITITTYYTVLKNILSKHALGNVIDIFSDIPLEKKVYALVTIGFYMFSIYQNTLVCYRFYKNFSSIHEKLFLTRDYLNKSIENMDNLSKHINLLGKYGAFNSDLIKYREKCIKYKQKIDVIKPFKPNMIKAMQIGHVMNCFYDLHIDETLEEIINYTFGVNAFIEHLDGLSSLKRNKYINKCKYSNVVNMVDSYYPFLLENNPVKNTIKLDKNMIITGPNASGKTTILKTALINQLFSQQFGYGFYAEKTTTRIYKNIHCYLNIPDTSGRDSLFQAEARRCKEILTNLEKNESNFCIFDELFSGTNPNEACASSYGFVKYLIQTKKIDFILTTHLLNLCDYLDKDIMNYNMKVEDDKEYNFNYTYILNKGISNVKGGLKVLKDLDYPEIILNDSSAILRKM